MLNNAVQNNLEDELKTGILDTLKYCINCRFCLPSCPLFNITSGEISHGGSGITRSLYYAVQWGLEDKETLNELKDILYECTTCGSCELACKNLSTGTKLVDAIMKGRELMIEKQIGPMPEQKRVLESLYKNGNPYMITARKRKAVVRELNLRTFDEKADVLLYLGCSTSIDQDVQQTAVALGQILDHSSIRYGVLEDESCCGEPSLKMGETGLFEEMIEKNLGFFKKHNTKKIVTLSPHCYDTFTKKYPQGQMQDLQVQHYTQLLAELTANNRLNFSKSIEKRVIYHDPCYLSKSNTIWEEPRNVIRSIPGVDLVEFAGNRSDSLCCGGGGGRMWTDFSAENDRLANIRVSEAVEKKAQVLVTTCPWCFINMNDGVKAVNAEGRLEILSLAELCAQAI